MRENIPQTPCPRLRVSFQLERGTESGSNNVEPGHDTPHRSVRQERGKLVRDRLAYFGACLSRYADLLQL